MLARRQLCLNAARRRVPRGLLNEWSRFPRLEHRYDFFGALIAFFSCCIRKISGLDEVAQIRVNHLPQLREFDLRFAGEDSTAELTFQELYCIRHCWLGNATLMGGTPEAVLLADG